MTLREMAAETLRLIEQRAIPGIEEAIAGTVLHEPSEPLLPAGEPNHTPSIEVTRESMLAAAARLPGAAVLVFASARNPGGGFIKGAQAQEESIARSSALYACQLTQPEFYRRGEDLRYTDKVIYSPGVPVFRDDAGRLLAEPFHVAMLTAAAPNLGALQTNQPERVASVPETLNRRAIRVLEVAAHHGHRTVVLGAWGCGVFRNDPSTVAEAFAGALRQVAYFDHVTFAILDNLPGSPVYAAFADRWR